MDMYYAFIYISYILHVYVFLCVWMAFTSCLDWVRINVFLFMVQIWEKMGIFLFWGIVIIVLKRRKKEYIFFGL